MDNTCNKWVVIKEVGEEPEALIIKSLLESEGIPVFIKQEAYGKAIGVQGLFSGIKILVLEQYAKEASDILHAAEFTE